MGDPQPEFDTVRVGLGERSYDVLVGSALLATAGELIAARTGLKAVAIVTDENVARHQLGRLEAALARCDIKVRDVVSVPPGEASKSFAAYAQLCDDLLACGLERRDGVIALGGGVIGDLAGFAASTVRRGVSMVQVPTSLLAQVDSSVGGKTGINTPHGKNLVGALYQPRLVLADIATLDTLPAREIAAGYAEVAKYGLLGDAAFFDWLETQRDAFAQRDASVLREAVRHSVQMKADIVARDETEAGERALLNLGHTFGHALEAWAGYDGTLLHGEAIAIGMCLAFALSEDLGHAPPQSAARVAGHLKAAGLPTRIGHVNWTVRPKAEDLMTLMMQDKKVLDGRLTLILARGIGQAFITRDVASEDVAEFLRGRVATDA